jgi:hypothetical protein
MVKIFKVHSKSGKENIFFSYHRPLTKIRVLPTKTPLSWKYNSSVAKGNRFNLADSIEELSHNQYFDVGGNSDCLFYEQINISTAIIDLTNTTKYYDPASELNPAYNIRSIYTFYSN